MREKTVSYFSDILLILLPRGGDQEKSKKAGEMYTEKCRKLEPQESVFYIYRVFSNDRRVLSKCNTRLRLPYFCVK